MFNKYLTAQHDELDNGHGVALGEATHQHHDQGHHPSHQQPAQGQETPTQVIMIYKPQNES